MRTLAISIMLTFVCFANASVMVFTDRPSFEAALGLPSGGGINTGFEQDSPQFLFPGTVVLNDFDLTIVGSPNVLNQITCCEPSGSGAIESHYFNGFLSNDVTNGPQEITFSFDTPLYGFGADFDQANNNGMGMIVNGTLVDFSDLLGPAVGDLDFGFIGVVDTMMPFSSATLVMTGGLPNQGEFFRMDNATLAPVPEPATHLLMLFGFLALLGLRRK
ncbi:MAG: PEP-CTERM sorting domain-containing protein [Planctomycetota bacterium]